MKYEADVAGHRVSLELEQRDGELVATVDGRSYLADVIRPERGVYLIKNGDEVFEATVSGSTTGLVVRLRGRDIPVTVIDRKHRRGPVDQGADGQQLLRAPMPGKVVRFLLRPGDEVTAGQGVVVVEAMKMQNEVKSPKKGRVVEFRVTEGAAVEANAVLAIIE